MVFGRRKNTKDPETLARRRVYYNPITVTRILGRLKEPENPWAPTTADVHCNPEVSPMVFGCPKNQKDPQSILQSNDGYQNSAQRQLVASSSVLGYGALQTASDCRHSHLQQSGEH